MVSVPPVLVNRHVRSLLATTWIVALPSLVSATTYYVSNSGSDANSGTAASDAFLTIGKANARAKPGDVVVVARGSYTQYPNPAVSGTATGRITYIGDLANPYNVTVTGTNTVIKDYVTWKGFHFQNGIYVTGTRDSVAWCRSSSGGRLQRSFDSVMAFCVFNGQRFWFQGSETDTNLIARRDTITNCVFNLTPTDPTGHTIRLKTITDCVMRYCRFNINVMASAYNASPTKLFWVRNCRFEDCYWDITNNVTTGSDEAGWFVIRDFSQSNVFARDTIIMKGPGQVQFFASCSGSYPRTCFNNNFDRCVIKNDGPNAYGHAFFWQDYAISDTVTNCVFVSRNGGLGFTERLTGPVLIDHCTIAAQKPWHGSVNLDIETQYATGKLTFTNNIVYTWPDLGNDPDYVALSANDTGVRGHLDAHHNLYYSRFTGDQTIWSGRLTGPGSGHYWCTTQGADCNGSKWGDPLFADASSVLGFDGSLAEGSPARHAGEFGSDMGADNVVGGDLTAPAAVNDLKVTAVGDKSVSLEWTSTGDDGSDGIANRYDVRWSFQPITPDNFTSASVCPGAPPPIPPGGTADLIAGGLTPAKTYYFAMKTRDESGNWSALSNVVTATTDAIDTTPPAAVQDLQVSP